MSAPQLTLQSIANAVNLILMGQSKEKPQVNKDDEVHATEEEREITRKWYNDTSFEGRTKAEFDALREEVRRATSLDFNKLRADRDYSRLIYENPLFAQLLTDTALIDVEMIYEERDKIGLSEEQFQRLLVIFGPEVQNAFRKQIAEREIVAHLYGQFSADELKRHSDETTAIMKKEIELQERNVPHEMLKPSLFPTKRKPRQSNDPTADAPLLRRPRKI
jgi:hypothetical protein